MDITNVILLPVLNLTSDENYFRDNVLSKLKDDETVTSVKALEDSDYILVIISKKQHGVVSLSQSSHGRDLPTNSAPEMSTFKQRAYLKKLLQEHGTPNSYTEEELKNMTKVEIGKKIKQLKNK